jgi:chromosome segregation ATPase
MTRRFSTFWLLGLIILPGLLLGSPAGAQGAISKETIDRLEREVAQLRQQVTAANAFVKDKSELLKNQEKAAANAPEDTDKMIRDLEALVDVFKAGGDISNTVQKAMQEIKVYIDRYREGSPVQKQATKSLMESLANFQASDANRDKHVGDALAAIRKLKAQRDDLIALRIAGSYQAMAQTYAEMISTFGTTVTAAGGVVKSIEQAANIPSR